MRRAGTAADEIDHGLPRPGRKLGRYELRAEIAHGGMASVFLARATALAGFDKLVAVKCIHPRFARDRAFIEMFLDEARIASRITHPNVCSVFDVGEDRGTYYLAMDYLHGESLSALLRAVASRGDVRGDPRYPAIVSAIVADAAEGLHAAHELRGDRGDLLHVVHRDVSPQNVFIGYDGTVRVVDFGIARAVGRLHKTLSGVVKGKVPYMSPEQLSGDVELDRRTDVWALGVTLWELLTCSRLFRREHEGDSIRAVLEEPVLPPSLRASSVPRELDDIVLRALRRPIEERYSTARDLGRELRRWIASQRFAVGSAELSETMDTLFAEQRAAKDGLVELARRSAVSADVPDTERMREPPADLVATAAAGAGEPGSREATGTIASAVRPAQTTMKEYPVLAPPPASAAAAEVPATRVAIDAREAAAPSSEPTSLGTRTDSVVLPIDRGGASWKVAIAGIGLALVAAGGVWIASSSEETATQASDLEPARRVAPIAASPSTPSAEPPALAVATPEPAPAEPAEPAAAALPARSRPRAAATERGGAPTTRALRGDEPAVVPRRASMEGGITAQPAATAEPSPPGRVFVGVEGGWGTIQVDGAPMGQAPRALELPPGRHVVEVMPFAEPPVHREVVVVRSGETARVVVRP